MDTHIFKFGVFQNPCPYLARFGKVSGLAPAGEDVAVEIVLLTLYAKAKLDNLTGSQLKEIRRALEE